MLPLDDDLLRRASGNDADALAELRDRDWSWLIDRKSPRTVRGDRGLLMLFVNEEIGRASLWSRWLEWREKKHAALDRWLRGRLERFADDYQSQLRRLPLDGVSAKEKHPELTEKAVEAALEVWRNVRTGIGKVRGADRKKLPALKRVLDALRDRTRDGRASELYQSLDDVVAQHGDAGGIDLLLKVAGRVLADHSKQPGWDHEWDVTAWLHVWRYVIRYGWIDWETGYPNDEFRRFTSRNLTGSLDSDQSPYADLESDRSALEGLLAQPLHRCVLPQAVNMLGPQALWPLGDSILGSDVSVDVLREVKEWAKKQLTDGDNKDGPFQVVYSACLAASLVNHRTNISQHPEQEVRASLRRRWGRELVKSQSRLRDLFKAAWQQGAESGRS